MNLRAERANLLAEVKWPPATSSSEGRALNCKGPGACSPENLNLMLQKRPSYAFLMVRASRFSSPGILKLDLIADHLTEDEILMALDKCDEPWQLL